MFSINPDAHSIAELDLMRWDLAMARKEAGRVRDTTTWCGRVVSCRLPSIGVQPVCLRLGARFI
jgi:hypothetical protein